MTIDIAWLTAQVATRGRAGGGLPSRRQVAGATPGLGGGFSEVRADVASPTITWPRRGLLDDEASSFLRALDSGFVSVDGAGFVVLPTVRAKTPAGRYALLSKSGSGVSINLEYLIQIGATAELVMDHGWSPADIDFERGEFDAVGVGPGDRVLLVMEAKARVSGPDSLEKLLTSWMLMAEDPSIDLNNNAGRKYRELQRLCQSGRVVVWLVAEGARWTLIAEMVDGAVRLTPGLEPDPAAVPTDVPTRGAAHARVIPLRREVPPIELGGCRGSLFVARPDHVPGDAGHIVSGRLQLLAVRLPARARRTGRPRRDRAGSVRRVGSAGT